VVTIPIGTFCAVWLLYPREVAFSYVAVRSGETTRLPSYPANRASGALGGRDLSA